MSVPIARCTLLTVVCEASLEDDLVADLGTLGATGYTITDARGSGAHGVRDAAWPPGANIRVEVLCDGRTAEAIAHHLEERYYADYAMVLFTSDVGVLRPRKFAP
ncbi:P-II family nitrogen regulator [Azospira restricta]|uniref:Transcriptional regulator n=1 Tax=Azospira restricta TaxID=404405 RepID=A0A974SPL2_9RHOO|nr:transcriptional regulator [Azospira restricta]QRJ64102.1 transcriptional regulator [Azospira restricta]